MLFMHSLSDSHHQLLIQNISHDIFFLKVLMLGYKSRSTELHILFLKNIKVITSRKILYQLINFMSFSPKMYVNICKKTISCLITKWHELSFWGNLLSVYLSHTATHTRGTFCITRGTHGSFVDLTSKIGSLSWQIVPQISIFKWKLIVTAQQQPQPQQQNNNNCSWVETK